MTWRQWGRSAALVVFLAALIVVPPSTIIAGSNDIVWCRPLGLEWREPFSLSSPLTPSQSDAVSRYLEQSQEMYEDQRALYLSQSRDVDGLDAARREEHLDANAGIVMACQDARQDRQTLIVIAAAFVLGVLIVRRNRLEPASRPLSTEPEPAPEEGQDQ